MKGYLILPLLGLSLAACSGNRKIKQDYVVKEAQEAKLPKWIREPSKADKGSVTKDFKYFIDYAENTNRRLCQTSAETRAKTRLSSEFSEFVKKTYDESVESGQDSVNNYIDKRLAKEVQSLETRSFLSGVEVAGTYWEKRQYLQEMGAPADREVYVCYTVVKMKKEQAEKVAEVALEKMLDSFKNITIKQETAEALKDVPTEFANSDTSAPIAK